MSTIEMPGSLTTLFAPVTRWHDHDRRAHVVQFYEDDALLIDALSRFIGAALADGEAAIVIAKSSHREALDVQLEERGLNTVAARKQGTYIVLDAAETLSMVMTDGSLDSCKFQELVGWLIERATASAERENPRVALFGDMVALLVEEGDLSAAIKLERLWNDLGRNHAFSLRCGYTIGSFSRKEDSELFLKICGEHTAVIPSESYTTLLTDDQRLRTIVELQQKAQALEGQRALQQSEEKFRLLVETVQDYAIFMLDPDGCVISWNAGAERIKGYKASEIMGKHFSVFYPPDEAALRKPDRELKIATAKGRFEEEGWRLRKDGSRFWANVVITALHDETGRLRGFAKVTRDITDRKLADECLRDLTGRLLSLQDEERRRLARELHDSTAQTLSALALNLALLQEYGSFAEHPRVAKTIADAQILAEQASREVRTFSYLLHPPLLVDSSLAEALRWYVKGFAERTRIQVALEVPADFDRLPQDAETTLFRIVQESLTNVYRHSGASEAGVRLSRTAAGIKLEVWDRGKGLPAEDQEQRESLVSLGVGIRGMRERVAQLGGRMELRSGQPGTIVDVVVPIQAACRKSRGIGAAAESNQCCAEPAS
jgi:PAS domain S-box-containing protein